MAELLEHLDGISPLIVAAYVIVALVAMLMLWRLSLQWQRHRVSTAARSGELLALVLVTVVGIALVAYAQDQFERQAQAQRLQAELAERDRVASVVRTRINQEIDTVRALLADRTVRHIERDTLADARTDLARFAQLKDPRIAQMLALIDHEIEVRSLVAHSLTERSPQALARLYTRLAELEPSNQEYRDKAAQFAADAAKGTP